MFDELEILREDNLRLSTLLSQSENGKMLISIEHWKRRHREQVKKTLAAQRKLKTLRRQLAKLTQDSK